MKVIPSIGYRLDILRENPAPDPEFGHVSENLAYLSENGQAIVRSQISRRSPEPGFSSGRNG